MGLALIGHCGGLESGTRGFRHHAVSGQHARAPAALVLVFFSLLLNRHPKTPFSGARVAPAEIA